MFRFLSPLLPSKSNSKSANFETYAKGIINLPYARTLDGCLYSRNLDPKITIEESVAPVSSELKIERPPLFEKQNSQKCSRLPVQRSSKESSNSNVAAWSSTYVTSGIPLAVTRRRSWRVHCVRPDLVDGATKTLILMHCLIIIYPNTAVLMVVHLSSLSSCCIEQDHSGHTRLKKYVLIRKLTDNKELEHYGNNDQWIFESCIQWHFNQSHLSSTLHSNEALM
uniref:Uncharacterized protein n=1 Tax=Heterorhabditis bacteriophora TaxID=37862 RepID=A0A1I7XPF4_HETBA